MSIIISTESDTSMFDLEAFRSIMLSSAWMTVQHPVTGQSTPLRLLIASPDSEEYRQINRKITNSRLIAVRKKQKDYTNAERMESEAIELLSGIILGWEGVSRGKEPLSYTKEHAKQLLVEFPFIQEQVDEFAGSRANFLQS